jgi:protein-L-isoaspartate(D-aspartate) O-methyltransferase
MKYLLIILVFFPLLAYLPQSDKYISQREKMVEEQISARGISDERILRAFTKVPRHLFVPKDMQKHAYADSPLPIGNGQTISQPYIVALMTQLANPEIGKRALEIGTGSGYQAAVLAELVDSVFTIEIVPELAKQASDLLKTLGYNNVVTRYGDGYAGWPEFSPYDIIIVTAAPEEIPQPLIDQLAENGRLIIPVGSVHSFQDLILIQKKNNKITRRRIASVRFVPFLRSLTPN